MLLRHRPAEILRQPERAAREPDIGRQRGRERSGPAEPGLLGRIARCDDEEAVGDPVRELVVERAELDERPPSTATSPSIRLQRSRSWIAPAARRNSQGRPGAATSTQAPSPAKTIERSEIPFGVTGVASSHRSSTRVHPAPRAAIGRRSCSDMVLVPSSGVLASNDCWTMSRCRRPIHPDRWSVGTAATVRRCPGRFGARPILHCDHRSTTILDVQDSDQ